MSRPRARSASGVAAAALLLGALSGCGQSEYCQAVEDNLEVIKSTGEKTTTAAYTAHLRAFRAVARVAPPRSHDDWNKMVDVTSGVLAAHKKIGLTMEEVQAGKLANASPEDGEILSKAYEAFNNTPSERTAVYEDVREECGLDIS